MARPPASMCSTISGGKRYTMRVGLGAEFARIGGCENCLDAPAGQPGFSPRVSYDITRRNLWGDRSQHHARNPGFDSRSARLVLTYVGRASATIRNLTLTFDGILR